ncbi:unnamed protein product [Prorocentrum cordatum]|uniref:Uncharacterized protein n=1 Tax=Prorocentrum cordatum TaxID=2364126 RepID=A0ABN9TQZ6_9DINO|nr:unnamed protein product [Polarella glacialis]
MDLEERMRTRRKEKGGREAPPEPGDTPLVHVREVREAIRLVWPDERVVVHDDLALDVRSPPAGLGLLAAAAEAPPPAACLRRLLRLARLGLRPPDRIGLIRLAGMTFSFQCKAYLIAQDRRYRPLPDKCEDGAQEVDGVNLSVQEEELSAQLYFALVLVMPEEEYVPSEAGNVLAMWTKLTDAKFEATDDVMVSISKLDEDMTKCQKMSGEPVSDLIERGILAKAFKDHAGLQKHVFRNSSRLNTCELLRAEVVSALTAERAARDDPMGIGGLKGGRKAWKGRGEGKEGEGEERQPNPDTDPECNNWRKNGHRSANSRNRIADEKKAAANRDDKHGRSKFDFLQLLRASCGAQISAAPREQVTQCNCAPTDSRVVGLKGIGGEEIERAFSVVLQVTGSSTAPSSRLKERNSCLYDAIRSQLNKSWIFTEGSRLRGRADGDPSCVQGPAGEKQVPSVLFDIFYVGTDRLAAKCKAKGGYFSIREKPLVTKADLEQAISVLNVIDCRILAQAALYANGELDVYSLFS